MRRIRLSATSAVLALGAAGLLAVGVPAMSAHAASHVPFYVCSTVEANTAIYKNPGADRIGTATKGDLFYSVQTVNGYDGGYDQTDNNTFGWIIQTDTGQPVVVCHPD